MLSPLQDALTRYRLTGGRCERFIIVVIIGINSECIHLLYITLSHLCPGEHTLYFHATAIQMHEGELRGLLYKLPGWEAGELRGSLHNIGESDEYGYVHICMGGSVRSRHCRFHQKDGQKNSSMLLYFVK